uniref:Uncharacterized protein n=1 Tax=Zea mays TaxID=4577 RepID=C4J6E0_MAIZE|nr:unknown [Zea mays]
MSSEAHVEDAAAADGGAASFPETVAAAAAAGGGCLLLAVVRRAAVLGRWRVRRRWRDVRRRRRAVGLLARRWVARLVAHDRDRWVASVDQISCKNSNELASCMCCNCVCR